MPVQKFPPPPPLPSQLQPLNRWLLELQNILNTGGTISPDNVDGLVQAYKQIAINVANIATNTADIATNTADIATNTANIAANAAAIAALTARVAALEARNQVYNGIVVPPGALGVVGDWYADTAAKHIYVKTAVGVWTVIV